MSDRSGAMTDAPQPAPAWDGLPDNPDVDGLHWVEVDTGTEFQCQFSHEWSAEHRFWQGGLSTEFAKRNWRYLGVALLPAAIAQRLAAARREGAEEMKKAAMQAAHKETQAFMHNFNNGIRVVIAAIRALPLPEPSDDR